MNRVDELVTGTLPVDALLDRNNNYHSLSFFDKTSLWSGCIDASDHIASGSTASIQSPYLGTLAYQNFSFRHLA